MTKNRAQAPLEALLDVMRRLRDPRTGCPWDREQTFETIAPYTIEEAYEVADAITSGDPARIQDELGDLLFQVVFHAQMAAERGWFDFGDVAAGITHKLTRRHPHVFGSAGKRSAGQQALDWERVKAEERAAQGASGLLDGVALGLPALTRAEKLGKRAARAGFDWQSAAGVRDKIEEELRELDRAVAGGEPHSRIAEELGDLLFSIANWARHQNLDPEAALRAANEKFRSRVQRMEQLAAKQGLAPSASSAAGWERLWKAAKQPIGAP